MQVYMQEEIGLRELLWNVGGKWCPGCYSEILVPFSLTRAYYSEIS